MNLMRKPMTSVCINESSLLIGINIRSSKTSKSQFHGMPQHRQSELESWIVHGKYGNCIRLSSRKTSYLHSSQIRKQQGASSTGRHYTSLTRTNSRSYSKEDKGSMGSLANCKQLQRMDIADNIFIQTSSIA